MSKVLVRPLSAVPTCWPLMGRASARCTAWVCTFGRIGKASLRQLWTTC